MKRKQRTHLDSIERKRDTAQRYQIWSEERQHQRGERELTTSVGLTQILVGRKMKKIHAVDLVVTNGR
jgi:hypothetical protein